MARHTMKDVRFYIDNANATLRCLGIRDRKLYVDSAYGGHRLNWLYESTAQSNIGLRGTTGEIYEQALVIAETLATVERELKKLRPTERELPCMYDARQSFYGKARVKDTYRGELLISYDTEVMKVEDGELFRKEDQPESATTRRHMVEFARQHGFNVNGKDDLMKVQTY